MSTQAAPKQPSMVRSRGAPSRTGWKLPARILAELASGGLTPNELAERLGEDPGAVFAEVVRLHGAGLLEPDKEHHA